MPSAPVGGRLEAGNDRGPGCLSRRVMNPWMASGPRSGEPLDKERSRTCRKADDYIRANPERQDTSQERRHDHPRAARRAGRSAAGFNCRTELILDTNVVLDWLVFDEPGVRPLVRADPGRRRIGWLATRGDAGRASPRAGPLGTPPLSCSTARRWNERIGRWASAHTCAGHRSRAPAHGPVLPRPGRPEVHRLRAVAPERLAR